MEESCYFLTPFPQTSYPTLTLWRLTVPSRQNRVKMHARTPRASLSNLRRFLTLDHELRTTSTATQRAYEQIELMWYLLFSQLADTKFDDFEAPVSDYGHPTSGMP
jgi:hypothetical protein